MACDTSALLPALSKLSVNTGVNYEIPKTSGIADDHSVEFQVNYSVEYHNNITDKNTLSMLKSINSAPGDIVFAAVLTKLAKSTDRSTVGAWMSAKINNLWSRMELAPKRETSRDMFHNCNASASTFTHIWTFEASSDLFQKINLRTTGPILPTVAKIFFYDLNSVKDDEITKVPVFFERITSHAVSPNVVVYRKPSEYKRYIDC